MADTKQAPHDYAEQIDHRAATSEGKTRPARDAMGLKPTAPAKVADPNAALAAKLAALEAKAEEQQKKIDWLMKKKETPAPAPVEPAMAKDTPIESAKEAPKPAAVKSDTTAVTA